MIVRPRLSYAPLGVFKDSWPSSKHGASERDMFKDTKDGFGLPKVICSYEVSYEKEGDHSFPVPDGAKYYDAFDEDGPEIIPPRPEQRTHTRTILGTVGEDWSEPRDPNISPRRSFMP